MKRVCLFAGYNVDAEIKPYVIDYLSELSNFSDVYYLADGELKEGELDKLKNICKNAWVKKHGKYDFGSYSELLKNHIGWDQISKYDEVIFSNDSCFCVNGFEPVFSKMSGKFDCWGLLATDENNHDYFYTYDKYKLIPSEKVPLFCIGSYFLVFKKEALFNAEIQDLFNSVKVEPDRINVCLNYEMRLTKLLQQEGLSSGCFVNKVYRNVAIYDKVAFKLVHTGFPLLKIKIFKSNPLSIPESLINETYLKAHVNKVDIVDYLSQVNYYPKSISQDDLSAERVVKGNNSSYSRSLQSILYMCKSNLLPYHFKQHSLKLAIAQITPPIVLDLLINSKRAFVARIKPRLRKIKANPVTGKFDLKETRMPLDLKYAKINPALLNEEWVVYFNVSRDLISGGMLSINRFLEKSLNINDDENKKIFLSGVPITNNVVDYTGFKSAITPVHLNKLLTIGIPCSAILNIPENFIPSFVDELTDEQRNWMCSIPKLRINILNQNNNYMPERCYIEVLKEISEDVTMTVAHIKYCTQKIANEYQLPVSLLTPFIPDFYRCDFHAKEKVIVLSPDNEVFNNNVTRPMFVNKLTEAFPEYSIVTVENMTLEEYKRLISKSRFTITFGEGYDGYFIEPALSSSVSFSVYNPTFFPENFPMLDNLYVSIEDMFEKIINDMKELEINSERYEFISNKTELEVKKFTNDDISFNNLYDFYSNKVDYLPVDMPFDRYKLKSEEAKHNV